MLSLIRRLPSAFVALIEGIKSMNQKLHEFDEPPNVNFNPIGGCVPEKEILTAWSINCFLAGS